ncbi:uncharacterized protein LOC120351678 [Nilaparvata lugens]|uniref:uncharacterized protein LOC120351678 n=1 Tax=Nilaparvata lugens TaxID=108931 RepID=UPI00193DA174|nr:uncharacterized protein LOC120351678 [Nilaparvata lugens]
MNFSIIVFQTVKPSISQLNSPNSSDIPVVWRGKTATSQPSQAADPSLSKSGMFPVAKLEETFKPASTKHYEKEDCNGGLGSSKMLNFLETNGARSTPKTYGGNARLSESDSTSVTPKTENPISVDQTLKIVTSNCNENVVNNTRSKRKSLFDFML